MAEQYDTPSGNPPPSPIEFALAAVARALREASDSAYARLEVYGGQSQAERDAGLAREADHARDLRHLAGEYEQLLRAFVGYRSDREVRRVPARGAAGKRIALLMGAVATLITALAAAWTAMSGRGKP